MSLAAFEPQIASGKSRNGRMTDAYSTPSRQSSADGSNPSSWPSLRSPMEMPGVTLGCSPGASDSIQNCNSNYTDNKSDTDNRNIRWQHLYVLPVLLLEFLAIALTRAVLPSILLQEYGNNVYLVLGCADCVRGLLAFVACPLFGKISDVVGRRLCLLVTVIGSCAPVCTLALFPWNDTHDRFIHSEDSNVYSNFSTPTIEGDRYLNRFLMNVSATVSTAEPDDESASAAVWPTFANNQHDNDSTDIAVGEDLYYNLPPNAVTIFIILLALSGIFSSTFTLVFAYISDTVRQRDERVSAYGLALATFGLSFTIGPMAGGYLAKSNTHYVFICSLILTILDVLYIYFVLPESRVVSTDNHDNNTVTSTASTIFAVSWSPWETLRVISTDPFLRRVGQVAFLYYTGLWAIISTLSLYAVKQFHLSPERLGELMSSLGLCTMIAEAVLVRLIVPIVGEKQAARLGLLSFALQCIVLGVAYEGWHLFICVAFSLLGNLVYPSLSSLVSGFVEPEAVGEALGAVNGVKALTEGIGPLIFGSLMTLSEHSSLPGWPYILASLLVFAAYHVAEKLPDLQNEYDEYIHELDVLKQNVRRKDTNGRENDESDDSGIVMQQLLPSFGLTKSQDGHGDQPELRPFLSDVEESEDDEKTTDDMMILPLTFASLMKQPVSTTAKTPR